MNVRVETYDGKSSSTMPSSEVPQFFSNWMRDSIKSAAIEETRLKAQRRGWHYDKNPGFHDLKGKFEDAERKNLASHVKLAISNAFQQKTAGIKDFLSGAVVGATYTPRTLAISTASPNKARSHFGKGWNVGHLLPYAALATGAYQLGKHLNKPKEEIQEEAVKSALAKFALLDEHGDPLGDLSKILREADFGFGGGKPQATNKMEIAPRGFFGPPAGMNSGDSASRMGGFNTGGGYTGV